MRGDSLKSHAEAMRAGLGDPGLTADQRAAIEELATWAEARAAKQEGP